MSEHLTVLLKTPEQGHIAVNGAWRQVKGWLREGKRLVLEIRPECREERHSRHFHSQINQISKQLGGDLANVEDAKRILISAFRVDTLDDVQFRDEWVRLGEMRMGRGLRGEVVMLGVPTKKFSNKLAKGFVEWLYAFGTEAGVVFKPWEDEMR
ncbi:recombination protein NinB [Delftia sp. HK171]|uniref:recombination protein NinB n=1 Tax=Delftia sp. HK171 TaxID=1920191 RepID=UPI00114F4107|nr:recombination protein NinB [Delftia sp. HK171]TQL87420.1 NinB protein [Delftia sp. HK171]